MDKRKRKLFKLSRMEFLRTIERLEAERCEICSGIDSYDPDCCDAERRIKELGRTADEGKHAILNWYRERMGMEAVKPVLTVEGYESMKQQKMSDRKIGERFDMDNNAIQKFKRDNGLIKPRTDTQNTHTDVQEFVQQTEDDKPTIHTDSVEHTINDALWTKYKTLQTEHEMVVNALEETKRYLKEEQETVSAIDKECAAHEKQYTDLIEERNNLFDQLADDKREYERVIHALQDRLDNLNSIEGYYRESEVNYRNLRCQVHALQEENADLQGMKQLAKMLAKEFVKEDAE